MAPQTRRVGILVVGGEAQRVDAVVVSIVGSIEVVDHTADRAILIAVVESADETEFLPHQDSNCDSSQPPA